MRSKLDFIREQGFTTEGCQEGLYTALMFQPRVIAGLVITGVVFQSPWLFLALSTVLYWGALFPGRNLFDAFINQRDGRSEAARCDAGGAAAEAIRAGHSRHVCHEHRLDSLRGSLACSVAVRERVRRRVDECRYSQILPPSLRVPPAVVWNSCHALSIVAGARMKHSTKSISIWH